MYNPTRTAELEDLKKQIDILDLAERLGMELRGRQARCFNSSAHKHNDSHFSLGLDNSTNRYKCFTCENKGSVIDLYMAIRGVEFKQALEELKNMYGVYNPATSYPKVYKPTNIQEPKREPVNTEDNKAIYSLL